MPEPVQRIKALVLASRRVLSIVVQLFLVVLANRLAFSLRFDNALPGWAVVAFWQMLPWLVAARAISFIPFRLYEGLWRYTSIYDLQALIAGVTVSSVVFYIVTRLPFGPESYPRSIFIIDALLITVFLGGIRLTRRLYAELPFGRSGKRVLVVGAGSAGELIVRDMKQNPLFHYQPVGFVDDDRSKVGWRIHGVPVLGTRNDLPHIFERYKPAEVLIAIPGADVAAVRSIVRALEPFKVPIKTLPNLREVIDGRVDVAQIRGLALEDLLTRAPIGLDRRPLHQLIAGRRVMVTGAGGSIGSELCRQIATLKPATLVILDRYENTLHNIRLELEDRKQPYGLFPLIGDVTDAARMRAVLTQHKPEIIFHAAAHKHVPLMEENPCEAVKNNVRGTRILAQEADACGVDRFILISTDKAVNSTSVMGASKRVAELLVLAQAAASRTSFSIVRFGNVLGSNGSVVLRFMEQIRKGGPVTITHPDIRRFFMLIPEAVQLVLHAASQAQSGATYVLDMGEQLKVLDLAHDLIRLSGLVPGEDIKIEVIGLRPGEKLFEELVGPDEDAKPSRIEKILLVLSRRLVSSSLLPQVMQLEDDAMHGNTEAVMAGLKTLATDFGQAAAAPPEPAAVAVSALPAYRFGEGEQPCPNCKTGNVHRSRARSLPERVRRELTSRRLFKCDSCHWRGWLMPLEFSESMDTGEPQQLPDLSSLDRRIERSSPVEPAGVPPREHL